MPILDALKTFIAAWKKRSGRERRKKVDAFLDELFRYFPFSPQAQQWLRQSIRVEVLDWDSLAGGGGWYADRRLVRLNTAQYEAAIHELTHALWHDKRKNRAVRDGFVGAVQRLAEDGDGRWSRVHTLAGHYVHGIADQPGFEQGMLLPESEWGSGGGPRGEWNDWEMFAGLASGCMADLRLLPPYLRQFYAEMFVELPPDAPPPESTAPHR
ncbi:MAG: hypothetical protein JW934_21315 [Anaerolineae bacterium]|nr:hypothetical protein [Anaerolineae bacterium]